MLALAVSAAVFWGVLAYSLMVASLPVVQGIALSMASTVISFGAVFGVLFILSVLKERSSVAKPRQARRA